MKQKLLLLLTCLTSFVSFSADQTSKEAFKNAQHANYQKIQQFKSGDYSLLATDTLIGVTPNDTFKITGTYSRSGDLWIVNDGVVLIQNANCTVDGNIFIIHKGKLIINNSTFTVPQLYTYYRGITLGNSAQMNSVSSTLKFGGYSHGIVLQDTAAVNFKNVSQTDFTTWGLYKNTSVIIDGCDKTGEFLMNESSKIDLNKCTEALIWHWFPENCNINWSFGKSDTSYNYLFNKNQAGISGIDFEVKLDSVYNVMWGAMITHSSMVTLTNSKMRAVGLLFFKQTDSVLVSDIQNNSNYISYQLPLADRSFNLNNSSVTTWSLYVANQSIVNIQNCVLGEVVSYHKSKVYGSLITVDGSGGHYEATDSSIAFLYNCNIPCELWSNKNALLMVSNCQSVWHAFSVGSSILIIAQTPALLMPPHPLENSVAWYAHINTSTPFYLNTINQVIGYAFIDKTITSPLMDFSSYELFYQKQGDATWTSINGGPVNVEVNNTLLANWNTAGLTAGNYLLKIVLTSNWANVIEATAVVNLSTLGLEKMDEKSFSLFPNPTSDKLILTAKYDLLEHPVVSNIYGQQLSVQLILQNNSCTINVSSLSPGIYEVRIGSSVKKFVKE